MTLIVALTLNMGLTMLYLSVKFHLICLAVYKFLLRHNFGHNSTSDWIVVLTFGIGT